MNCFICHDKLEQGQTCANIHTGCMALYTPNAQVEKDRLTLKSYWLGVMEDYCKEKNIEILPNYDLLAMYKGGYNQALFDLISHLKELKDKPQ